MGFQKGYRQREHCLLGVRSVVRIILCVSLCMEEVAVKELANLRLLAKAFVCHRVSLSQARPYRGISWQRLLQWVYKTC